MDREIGLPGNDDGFKFGFFFVCRDRGWLTGMRRLRELSVVIPANCGCRFFLGSGQVVVVCFSTVTGIDRVD